MLGGSTFGIANDDPYFFSGHTVNQLNLLSQLEAAGKTWKGYYQGMPSPLLSLSGKLKNELPRIQLAVGFVM